VCLETFRKSSDHTVISRFSKYLSGQWKQLKLSYLMKHNKLCSANAGRTYRLPRLVTQVQCAFVHNGCIRVPKQTCLVPRQHAMPSLPKADIICFAQLLVEKLQFYFGRTGQLPPLTWYIQSLCTFAKGCSTEHIEKFSYQQNQL